MRNSVSDVTDAEILDEAREAMTQAAFDAADEANAAQAVESATESLPAFNELGLSDEILRAIENLGYTAPTPCRPARSPWCSRVATCLPPLKPAPGKTAAFLLPTMNNLEHIAPPKPVRERGGRNRPSRCQEARGQRPRPRDARHHPHARARPADRRGREQDRRRHRPCRRDRRGWRELQAADRGTQVRLRYPGRHAGPSGRPDRAGQPAT